MVVCFERSSNFFRTKYSINFRSRGRGISRAELEISRVGRKRPRSLKMFSKCICSLRHSVARRAKGGRAQEGVWGGNAHALAFWGGADLLLSLALPSLRAKVGGTPFAILLYMLTIVCRTIVSKSCIFNLYEKRNFNKIW